MIAIRDKPVARSARDEVAGGDEQERRPEQDEEVEPLIAVQERNRRAGLEEIDPLHPPGERLEVLVAQQLRRRHREREGRQREVEAVETKRRQSEQETADEADRAGRHDGPVVGDLVAVDHDRGGVGAERVESAVPEGELPVEAGEKVQAQHRDRVDHCLGELEHGEARDREGQRQRDGDAEHERGGAPSWQRDAEDEVALGGIRARVETGHPITPCAPPRDRTVRRA